MSEKNVLILNGIIVTTLVLYILYLRRSPKAPVKLELRDEDRIAADNARDARPLPNKPEPKFRDPRLPPENKVVPIGASNYTPRVRKPQVEVLAPEGRPLIIYFMWNGHSWDAYEVLGIPGGSEPEIARVAYDRAAALADKETLPFLQAALDVISKS